MFKPPVSIIALILMSTLAACAPRAQAPDSWTLVSDASAISFVTVKNGDVIEAHHFTDLSGTVSSDGAAQLTIQSASLETYIDIRNERVRDILLQVTQFPIIEVSANLDAGEFGALLPGAPLRTEIEMLVTIAGTTRSLYADVLVTRGDDGVSVATLEPVIVDMRDYGLGDAVEALRAIANLDAITPAIAVSARLAFEPT